MGSNITHKTQLVFRSHKKGCLPLKFRGGSLFPFLFIIPSCDSICLFSSKNILSFQFVFFNGTIFGKVHILWELQKKGRSKTQVCYGP